MITHDLGIIAEMCDSVNVMYAGQIVEQADVFDLFDRPLHPYTRGLLASIPKATERRVTRRLPSIPGIVPDLARIAGRLPLSPALRLRHADLRAAGAGADRTRRGAQGALLAA